ncbi:MAG: radical SAM protein [Thaumarchaeota archaeon]|nr:MAG: radical SAM protein [Nitrososphaerota archaeon]
MLRRSLKPAIIQSIPILTRSKPKVWLEAYGCSASMADSEMISGLLRGAGYEIASKQSEGTLNLIVTCSVKDTTEHRMVSRIRAMSKSGKPLVVAGCMPKANRTMVESLNSSASLLGPHSIDRVTDVVGSTLAGTKLVALEDSSIDKVNIPRVRLNPVVREVWLTSTDNGCYGKDIGTDLVELLKACCSVEGDFKIRLGMMNPMYMRGMLERMIGVFCENDKLFRFLHIPVESGSDRVLRKMKRGHTARTFLDAAQAFRSKIRGMTISTDVIVGFPSETEHDFEETLDLIERAEPDIVNISRYGARPGTEAAKWKGIRVGSEVSKERSEHLHSFAKRIAKRRNSLWLDWEGEIIIDEMGKVVQGRNYAYKPVVLSNPGKVSIGDKMRVKVHDFSNFSLKAKII